MKEDPKGRRGPSLVDGWFVADAPLPEDPIDRLVYYARLAPSSHNSQPWRFAASGAQVDVFADGSRWLSVADRDRRELHVSLGCAVEALRIAADYAGFGTTVRYFPVPRDETLVARVAVALRGPKREASAADLLRPLVTRRTSHRLFERSRPVPAEDRRRLQTSFDIAGVSLHFIDAPEALAALAALETRADARLFADPEYRRELGRCIGEGLLGPSWLLAKLGRFAVEHLPVAERVGREDAARMASAPLVALLATRDNQRIDQLRTGEAFLRLALVAEAHEIRVQPMSQMLEVPEMKAEVARHFALQEGFAQHLFRLGHAEPEVQRPPRRPLESVLVR